MRRMDARRRKIRPLRLRFSQSLASRRQRLSHAMVRSMIHRRGRTTKPLAQSERLTISVAVVARVKEKITYFKPSIPTDPATTMGTLKYMRIAEGIAASEWRVDHRLGRMDQRPNSWPANSGRFNGGKSDLARQDVGG